MSASSQALLLKKLMTILISRPREKFCHFEFYTFDHKIDFYGNSNMETGVMAYKRMDRDLYYVKFDSIDKMFINEHANKPAEFDYIDIYSDSVVEQIKKRDKIVKDIAKKNTANMFEGMFKF